DGVILTCEHVIRGALRLQVKIDGSPPLPGRVLSTDPACDLALVRVASNTLDTAEFGDAAQSRAGDPVAVLRASILGNANTSDQWLEGTIRTLGCSLPDAFGHDENRDYRDLIETTAPIRPGDSGAPWLDPQGCVIGIVTARGLKKNTRQATGFAIPINSRTRRILDRMLAAVPYSPAGSRRTASISSSGRFRWRGALMEPLSPLLLQRSPELTADALRILEVGPDTPAAQAGLQPGDVLVALEPSESEAGGGSLEALPERVGPVRLRLANGAIRSVPPPPPPSNRPSP
ncbi:MAG: trypsin-like peptidase domain-containing protein, partial [Phycisphaerae bacterium]